MGIRFSSRQQNVIYGLPDLTYDGDTPVCCLKTLEKCEGLEKPRFVATSVSDREQFGTESILQATSTRRFWM